MIILSANLHPQANAVARLDNLQFLEDVVPRTTTYREFKAKKARAPQVVVPLQNGQTTLDARRPLAERPATGVDPQANGMDDDNMSDGTIDAQTVEEGSSELPKTNGGLIFEHYEPNGNIRPDQSEDVEMG